MPTLMIVDPHGAPARTKQLAQFPSYTTQTLAKKHIAQNLFFDEEFTKEAKKFIEEYLDDNVRQS